MHRTRCLPASLSVCECVCVGAQSNGTRAECSLFQRMLELDWNAVNLASSQQHQQRPGPTTIERVGASAAELPSCRVNEPTRQRDAPITKLTLPATRCEMLSVMPLCRYSIPAAACGPQQLSAKRASGSLRERQQSLQYTFSRERERESGREWERERMRAGALKALACFSLLFDFFSAYFCWGFLSHFLLNSAVPYCKWEEGVVGGRGEAKGCVLCGAVYQFRQFARLQTI